MSLALKVKSLVFALASKPQVLENCPILGSRIAVAYFLNQNFVDRVKRIFEDLCFWRSPERFFEEDFFSENTCPCVLGLWPRAFLFLASRGPVLGKAVLGLGLFFVSLASSLVSSTPPLLITVNLLYGFM